MPRKHRHKVPKAGNIMQTELKDILKEVAVELSEARLALKDGKEHICRACLDHIRRRIKDYLA